MLGHVNNGFESERKGSKKVSKSRYSISKKLIWLCQPDQLSQLIYKEYFCDDSSGKYRGGGKKHGDVDARLSAATVCVSFS